MKKKAVVIVCSMAATIVICWISSAVWRQATKFEDIVVTLHVKHDSDMTYSLFYIEPSNEHFSEKLKKIVSVPGSQSFQSIKIPLVGVAMITKLRLDMDSTFQTILLSGIEISGETTLTLKATEIDKAEFLNIKSKHIENEGLRIAASQADPHIVFEASMASMRAKILAEKIDYSLSATIFIVSFLTFFRIISSLFENAPAKDIRVEFSPDIFCNYPKKDRKIYYYDFVFLAVLSLLLVIPMTKISEKKADEKENRLLASRPSIMANHGFNYLFAEKFETFFNDRFRNRDLLIQLKDTINSWVRSGRVENDFLFLGSDGWFFLKTGGSIENFQNRNRFEINELETICHNLAHSKEWFNSRGIAYYVFIPPDKSRVYGEYYPQWVNIVHPESRLEQLKKYLGTKQSDVTLVTPHEILRKQRDKLLYFKEDSHWNSYGAYLGYLSLMNAVEKDFSPLSVLTMDDFLFVPYHSGVGQGDLIMRAPISEVKIKEYLQQSTYTHLKLKKGPTFQTELGTGDSLIRYFTSNPQKKLRVLVIHDSFMSALGRYISETFEKVYFVHNSKSFLSTDLPLFLEKNRIDIVIFEIIERDIVLLKNRSVPFPGVIDDF